MNGYILVRYGSLIASLESRERSSGCLGWFSKIADARIDGQAPFRAHHGYESKSVLLAQTTDPCSVEQGMVCYIVN